MTAMSGMALFLFASLCFALSVACVFLSLPITGEGLFDKHRHWVRPLLFASGLSWFCWSMAIIASAGGKGL